jgi:predicted transcriptional regulator
VDKTDFKLEQLFGSKTRARLLGLFLQHQDKAFFVRELTRKIEAQLNSVRRELKNLVELGLVCERLAPENAPRPGSSLAERKKYYIVNTNFVLFEDLKSLFQKVQILLKNTLVQEIAQQGDIAYFAFTGKFVDRTDIPTDLLIVGSIDPKNLQKIISTFENEVGREVNYTLLPKDEFLYRRQVTDRFLMSILNGEKIVTIDTLGQ